MSKADFEKFVERQKQEEKELAAFDPEQEIKDWLEYLDNLYSDISMYMASYIEAESAVIDYRDIELNEEFSGPYKVRQMSLKIGNSTVAFKPLGTMLIGAKGRVDVQGPHGIARLVLIAKKVASASQLFRVTVSTLDAPKAPEPPQEDVKKIEWVWKIASPAPNMHFIELTQDTFFDMILSVADV